MLDRSPHLRRAAPVYPRSDETTRRLDDHLDELKTSVERVDSRVDGLAQQGEESVFRSISRLHSIKGCSHRLCRYDELARISHRVVGIDLGETGPNLRIRYRLCPVSTSQKKPPLSSSSLSGPSDAVRNTLSSSTSLLQ